MSVDFLAPKSSRDPNQTWEEYEEYRKAAEKRYREKRLLGKDADNTAKNLIPQPK